MINLVVQVFLVLPITLFVVLPAKALGAAMSLLGSMLAGVGVGVKLAVLPLKVAAVAGKIAALGLKVVTLPLRII